MKTFLLKNPKRILAIAGLASICGLFGTASAQMHKERVYANFQGVSQTGLNLGLSLLTGTVSNGANAISTSIRDSSTLSYTASVLGIIGATQFLEFTTDGTNATPRNITKGTPIYIKVKLPTSLIGVLDGLEIGTFTNLHTVSAGLTNTAGYDATNEPVLTNTNIVNLISGAGTAEFKVIPTVDCNGVYIHLSSTLGVASSANVFSAYILEDQAGDAGCPKPYDWLNGSNTSGTLNITDVTGATTNPQSAIDGNENTAATFTVGAKAASVAYYTALLNTPAKSGDSVRIVLDNPKGGLLNVSLLSDFTIQAYNDNTAVGTPITNDPSLLKVQLLPGATDKNVITAAIPGTFNRIQISMGGVADLSSLLGNGTLNIYEIGVKVPAPNASAGVTNANQYAYAGNNVVLKANANANGDAINWYTNANGTGGVASTITNPAVGTYTYYALSSRDGCVDASGVDTLNLHVVAASNPGLPAGNVDEPYSQVVTVDGPTTGLPSTPTYKFTFVSSTNPSGVTVDATTLNSNSFGSIGARIALAKIPAVYGAGPLNISQFATTPIDLGDGLQYNVDDNTIEGTPKKEGNYAVTFSVHDETNDLDVGNITKTISIGAALPVTLTNFDVNLDANKNAVVTWTTESEQGSIRFDVLRSNDGTNFSTIGSVDAAGISTKALDYSFTDHNPGAKSYYKLNVVKNDGIKSSNIVSITGGRVAGFSINPNPASNDITITGLSDIKTVSIYDASGRLVQTATNSHISVRNLSQGIYFVTVVTKDGNKVNSKFIKK